MKIRDYLWDNIYIHWIKNFESIFSSTKHRSTPEWRFYLLWKDLYRYFKYTKYIFTYILNFERDFEDIIAYSPLFLTDVLHWAEKSYL